MQPQVIALNDRGLWVAWWRDGRRGLAFGVTLPQAVAALKHGTKIKDHCERCAVMNREPGRN